MVSKQRSIWVRILFGLLIVLVVAAVSFIVPYFIARHMSAACISFL